MNNIERRDQQILYISDDAVFEEQKKCRAILQKLNFMDRADFAGISALVKELFGASDGAFLNPPFYCDYGCHIHVGKNFFANYNCTIIDVAPVVIGDNCQMAPNVAIYTAGHPVHPELRAKGLQFNELCSEPIPGNVNEWQKRFVTLLADHPKALCFEDVFYEFIGNFHDNKCKAAVLLLENTAEKKEEYRHLLAVYANNKLRGTYFGF